MTQTQRTVPRPAVADAAVPAMPTPSPQATRAVRLVAGADVQEMDLAGRRVADARAVAQAIFAVRGDATALVDGREVTEDQLLAAGQVLEFVRYAGEKGAGTSTIELVDDRAVWRRGGEAFRTLAVRDLLERAGGTGAAPPAWRLYPQHVRLVVERGGGRVTAVVVEMPPAPRRVRWMTDDSPAPFGPEGRYAVRVLSFPWIVLVVVFAGGELTGVQQAFYRTAPLSTLDDELCFTNLLNVAHGHRQESWVCLVNLAEGLGRLGWEERVQAVTRHFWEAAFTRSSEVHEGNSFWEAGAPDPRLATAAAWEAATHTDPYFTLGVHWRPSPRRLGQTVARMLDLVAPWRPIERVEQLVTLMQQERA